MKQPTMRYSPTRKQGSTPSEKKPIYYYKVFEGDEVDSCLKDGWYAHFNEFPKKEKPKTKGKK